MSSQAAPTRVELLALEVDCRLADLWALVDNVDEWTLERVAEFLRPAYVAGYMTALSEPVPGELCTAFGYRVPERRVI